MSFNVDIDIDNIDKGKNPDLMDKLKYAAKKPALIHMGAAYTLASHHICAG